MKKTILTLCLLLMLVGCANEKKPTINVSLNAEDITFKQGEKIDFQPYIVGNVDVVHQGQPDTTVGKHFTTVLVANEYGEKEIEITYTIIGVDNALGSLSVNHHELTPAFDPEETNYEVVLNEGDNGLKINAETRDASATIDIDLSNPILVNAPQIINIPVISQEGVTKTYSINVVKKSLFNDVTITKQEEDTPPSDVNGIQIYYPESVLTDLRSDYLTLVDKEHRLAQSYVPEDLVYADSSFQVGGAIQISKVAYDAFLQIRQDSLAQGLNITLTSCYRSIERQRSIYLNYLNSNVQSLVDTFSARPGHSEHHLGLACDFSAGLLTLGNFTGTAEQLWMKENAHKYGFILSYPAGKEEITGYMYESWHYRFVGKEHAEIMNQNNLTLTEYLNQ